MQISRKDHNFRREIKSMDDVNGPLEVGSDTSLFYVEIFFCEISPFIGKPTLSTDH